MRRAAVFLACIIMFAAPAFAQFETIGVPVRKAGLMGTLVGPGPEPGSERIYFNFRQDGGKLFLVAVDPETGASEQFASPAGTGAWGLIAGPDGKIYLGTHEGPDPQDNGQILVFDPQQPDKRIQIAGRPAESETYLWMFAQGPDGKLYAGTYPSAKIVSYDPATGAMADHGVMDETQMYTRNIVAGPDGMLYTGIGYGRANIVRFDPATGEKAAILPDEYRRDPLQTTASVWLGVDGAVYVSALKLVESNGAKSTESVTLKVVEGALAPAENPPAAQDAYTLKDGRRVLNATLDGTYELHHPDGAVEKKTFAYAGDGAGLFIVANGPLGRIYAGSYMPNEIAWYDPETGAMENPGNPSEVGGEIYSMLIDGPWLYTCSYPGSFLSKWDPAKPWNYGREAENNPRGFGPLGKGHLRPRAMIHGDDGRIYIGSFPEYGMHGGAMAVWDPKTDALLANYHNLVPNQSIISLAYDAGTNLVFGGTSTQGGGGTEPIEKEARFFAFDPAAKKLVRDIVPVPGSAYIRALCQVGRRLYGIAGGDTLFVYDIDAAEVVHAGSLGVGSVLDCALRLWTDGKLYAVASKKIVRIDPATYAVEVLAEYPETIRCGMAIDGRGIYFGVRAELVRYNWK